MPKIRAAVCHEFGKPLVLEEVMLREPAAGELEVPLGPVQFVTLIFPLWMEIGVGIFQLYMDMKLLV